MAEPEVMQPQKKMTRDEKRSLEKVINGDFDILQSEFNEQIRQAQEQEIEETKERFSRESQSATDFLRELRELKEQLVRQLEDKMREGRNKGLEPDRRYGNSNQISVNIPTGFVNQARRRALEDVETKYRDIAFRARNALQRKRLASLRTLALTGVSSEEATNLLNAIPNAEEVLREAEESREHTIPLLPPR